MFWLFRKDVWKRISSKLKRERDQNEEILEQLKQANRIFATAYSTYVCFVPFIRVEKLYRPTSWDDYPGNHPEQWGQDNPLP